MFENCEIHSQKNLVQNDAHFKLSRCVGIYQKSLKKEHAGSCQLRDVDIVMLHRSCRYDGEMTDGSSGFPYHYQTKHTLIKNNEKQNDVLKDDFQEQIKVKRHFWPGKLLKIANIRLNPPLEIAQMS